MWNLAGSSFKLHCGLFTVPSIIPCFEINSGAVCVLLEEIRFCLRKNMFYSNSITEKFGWYCDWNSAHELHKLIIIIIFIFHRVACVIRNSQCAIDVWEHGTFNYYIRHCYIRWTFVSFCYNFQFTFESEKRNEKPPSNPISSFVV